MSPQGRYFVDKVFKETAAKVDKKNKAKNEAEVKVKNKIYSVQTDKKVSPEVAEKPAEITTKVPGKSSKISIRKK